MFRITCKREQLKLLYLLKRQVDAPSEFCNRVISFPTFYVKSNAKPIIGLTMFLRIWYGNCINFIGVIIKIE